MLLELQNTTDENINKLPAFAQENNLQLTVVDGDQNNFHLPGKPLTSRQLDDLIANSRKSGTISLEDAHEIIRKGKHEN